jgi:hypothetical protein
VDRRHLQKESREVCAERDQGVIMDVVKLIYKIFDADLKSLLKEGEYIHVPAGV